MDNITLAIILLMHYVADFLLQSQNVRKNKHDSLEEMFTHIGIYSVVMMCTTWVLGLPPIWWAINVLAHLAVDFMTAPASHSFFSTEDYWWGMNIVGLDQLIHIFILIATYNLYI